MYGLAGYRHDCSPAYGSPQSRRLRQRSAGEAVFPRCEPERSASHAVVALVVRLVAWVIVSSHRSADAPQRVGVRQRLGLGSASAAPTRSVVLQSPDASVMAIGIVTIASRVSSVRIWAISGASPPIWR